jgi:hypothetical protein
LRAKRAPGQVLDAAQRAAEGEVLADQALHREAAGEAEQRPEVGQDVDLRGEAARAAIVRGQAVAQEVRRVRRQEEAEDGHRATT